MENEIKVNDFVRLQNGVIGIVIEIKTVSTNMRGEHAYAYKLGKTKKYNSCWVEDYAIVKHSSNLIDLIQCGDYVNGKYVDKIEQYKDGKSIIALIGIIDEADIKEVVTKEMMESISYKVTKM